MDEWVIGWMVEYKSRKPALPVETGDEIIIENRNHMLNAKSRKPALPFEAGDDMIIDLSLVHRVVE
jgi:hypothetical protein